MTVQEVPNPQELGGSWTSDMAEIFEPETEAQLNRLISSLETKNGAEIAVVAVPETAPAPSPKQFATELFNYWKIGKKGENNGLLLLVSRDDRRVEIETGLGLDAQLPDTKVAAILEESEISSRFQESDFDGGIMAVTQALVETLSSLPQSDRISFSSESAPENNKFWSGLVLVLCIILVPWSPWLASYFRYFIDKKYRQERQEQALARNRKTTDKRKSAGVIDTNDGWGPDYNGGWGSSFGDGSFGGGGSDGGGAGCDF
ncbi:MAG: TPM domain-containing protein [Oscillatoria sp. SIO1A7]|nr:TPM domain-containing protein [Oscillatoria sp. SIO1A7]